MDRYKSLFESEVISINRIPVQDLRDDYDDNWQQGRPYKAFSHVREVRDFANKMGWTFIKKSYPYSHIAFEGYWLDGKGYAYIPY